MLQRLSKETIDYFLNILNNTERDLLVDVNNRQNPFAKPNIKGLKVVKASLGSTHYSGDDDTRKLSDYAVEGEVQGIVIEGYHHRGLKETPVKIFNPNLSSITVHKPKLKHEVREIAETGVKIAKNLFGLLTNEVKDFLGENESQENVRVYKIPMQRKLRLEVSEDHEANVDKLYKAIVSNPEAAPLDILKQGDRVADIVYNKGDKRYNMFITDVKKMPEGVMIKFKDLMDYQGVKPAEMLLRVLNDQHDLPLPNADHYCLIQSLDQVNLRPVKEYASRTLLGGIKKGVDITAGKVRQQDYY